jgi:hypothetical protein
MAQLVNGLAIRRDHVFDGMVEIDVLTSDRELELPDDVVALGHLLLELLDESVQFIRIVVNDCIDLSVRSGGAGADASILRRDGIVDDHGVCRIRSVCSLKTQHAVAILGSLGSLYVLIRQHVWLVGSTLPDQV